MTIESKTYSIRLTSSYTPNSIIEICHFRDLGLVSDEKALIRLEAVQMVLSLANMKPAIIPDFDGDETESEKVNKFNAAEARSEKFGLQFLSRKNNTGEWDEIVELIIVNRERKDYIDSLQPFFSRQSVRLVEQNDAFAVKLIDYGYGLLKISDSIKLILGCVIEVSKKNDIAELEARMAALELALQNRLINLAPGTLLGRDETTGTVEQIQQSRFATPAMIDQAIADMAGGAPTALNTLIELASALNNDANFGSNVINLLSTKAPIINPAFTGNVLSNGANVFTKNMSHANINPDGYGSGIASADSNIDGTLRGWHFLTLLRGGNSDFGIQLALSDTSNVVRYRRKASGVWNSWVLIVQA